MMPKRSLCRIAQFDTLRLRLIIAPKFELKPNPFALADACPDQTILRLIISRLRAYLIDEMHKPLTRAVKSKCKKKAIIRKKKDKKR